MDAFRKEPTLIIALIEAVLALVVAVGLPVDPELKVAIIGVVVAAGAVWTRQSVYAPATVEQSDGHPVAPIPEDAEL